MEYCNGQIFFTYTGVGKRWRYGLGVQLEGNFSDLLEQLIAAQHAPRPHKPPLLLKANVKLDLIRLQLRLYLELALVNGTIILQLQAKLAEIGRMLGGWYKSTQNS